MGNHKLRIVRPAKLVHAFGNDAQSVDVQARVRLVENSQFRFKDSHLEDFILFLFAPGEPFVDRSLEEILSQLQHFHFLLNQPKEINGIKLR